MTRRQHAAKNLIFLKACLGKTIKKSLASVTIAYWCNLFSLMNEKSIFNTIFLKLCAFFFKKILILLCYLFIQKKRERGGKERLKGSLYTTYI